MTEQHSITPPPELLQQWAVSYWGPGELIGEGEKYIATQAARWGADMELEACCEWLVVDRWESIAGDLRAARRPKPPSLAEQALKALTKIEDNEATYLDSSAVRCALERLQELENNG